MNDEHAELLLAVLGRIEQRLATIANYMAQANPRIVTQDHVERYKLLRDSLEFAGDHD